jgi:aldoxime dehydratase
MGYFGVQAKGKNLDGKILKALQDVVGSFKADDGPKHHDLGRYCDADGYDNIIAIAYWDNHWGSMRDRFPLSQTDRMSSSGELNRRETSPAVGTRVVVSGHSNLAIIRSGQDWVETEGEERKAYLEEMEPTLRVGMDFLRDDGSSIGCYSNRYMRHINLDGELIERSFGLSHWRSLDLLERWAESHPTHLQIFTTFFRIAAHLAKLRLYHEVSVLDADAQYYEYINCHPNTGLIRDARPFNQHATGNPPCD